MSTINDDPPKCSQQLRLIRSDRCLCPLCHNPRGTFYCSDCIRFGDFSHSNPFRQEILAEKRIRLRDFSLKSSSFCQKIEDRLDGRDEAAVLGENKRLTELKIRYLKEIIAEKRKKCEDLKDVSQRISSLNSKRRLRLPQFASRTKKMREYYMSYCHRVSRHRSLLKDLQVSITPLRIKHLRDLVQFIFPIEKIYRPINKDEVEEDHDELADILAEAMRTSFVHGRWITANSENSEEIQYRIVNPSLPSTGNYTSYYHCGAGEDQVVMIAPCSSSPDASEVSLLAGLSYVVQLVKLIAIFTDVILPQKMSLSDFHSASPCYNEYRFARRVAALNTNVVYLICCAIDEEEGTLIQDPLRTLQNIHGLMLHLQKYPSHKLRASFNDQRIKNPEAFVIHTKKIFAEVEKVKEDGGLSSNNDEEETDSKSEFRDSDVDDDWISVPDNDPSIILPPSPHVSASNIVSSLLRGFSGSSGS